MAGRKDKNTVDYFPHYVNHGKTLFIIESKFGNDGYAAWFKILEALGSSEHHYIDCRKDEDWEFLNAKIKLMHTSLQEVLDLCAKLGAINKTLWENKVIWSENFVKNISDAYTRRSNDCPNFNDIVNIIGINVNINTNNDGNNTQSKVKYSKEEKITNDDVENVYSVYPAKCPIKFRSTGKGKKDKDKIKQHLRTHSPDELKQIIIDYVQDCKQSKCYIKNFSTFLNNLPEKSKPKPQKSRKFDTTYEDMEVNQW